MAEKIDGLLEALADVGRKGEHTKALEDIRVEIRSATSSMTSVPKPLKFLRPHFDLFKKYYEEFTGETEKVC